MIKFLDLHKQYLSIKDEIDNAISNVITDTAFIKGKYVREFEENFANKIGIKHCIGVGNGTDAIYIAFKMMGVGNGDEVIVPANSWISSSEAVSLTGAKPIFIDIEEDYFTINPDLIEKIITDKTKVIMPVHLFGQACDMDRIMCIAKKYHLQVLEDCAQSHFTKYKDQYVGTFGDAAIYSFYPGKNLGAYGDAGAIITNNDQLAEKCRMFANHGSLTKHQHQIEGINSRLDGFQAAILNVKLNHIDEWNSKRREIARVYYDLLKDYEDIVIPKERINTYHTYHLYVIRAKESDTLKQQFEKIGIQTQIHYPMPLPFLKPYEYQNNKPEDFPVAWRYKDEILSMPVYAEINTKDLIKRIKSLKHEMSKYQE
jgi:dTDP-4-amino-4,6-dideoxygalactose transaminase